MQYELNNSWLLFGISFNDRSNAVGRLSKALIIPSSIYAYFIKIHAYNWGDSALIMGRQNGVLRSVRTSPYASAGIKIFAICSGYGRDIFWREGER